MTINCVQNNDSNWNLKAVSIRKHIIEISKHKVEFDCFTQNS